MLHVKNISFSKVMRTEIFPKILRPYDDYGFS